MTLTLSDTLSHTHTHTLAQFVGLYGKFLMNSFEMLWNIIEFNFQNAKGKHQNERNEINTR